MESKIVQNLMDERRTIIWTLIIGLPFTIYSFIKANIDGIFSKESTVSDRLFYVLHIAVYAGSFFFFRKVFWAEIALLTVYILFNYIKLLAIFIKDYAKAKREYKAFKESCNGNRENRAESSANVNTDSQKEYKKEKEAEAKEEKRRKILNGRFFDGMTYAEAKSEYHRLLKKYHPDNGAGDDKMAQEITRQFAEFRKNLNKF